MPKPQSADTVIMVLPLTFAPNPQTQSSNALQSSWVALTPEDRIKVQREFDLAAARIKDKGVRVITFDPPPGVETPDAVFPNNWFSTHADGTVVLYPMMAPNRRLERQPAILNRLAEQFDYTVSRVVDLTALENEGIYVEGTGSLVFDHSQQVVFASLSPRTNERGVELAAGALGYEACTFSATHRSGAAVYHTNVMLSVGRSIVVGCFDMIRSTLERGAMLRRLISTVRCIVSITEEQAANFAANVLELRSPDGPLLVVSQRAWNCLDASQRQLIERQVMVLVVDVGTIEQIGGGGIRCMLAEVFLPHHAPDHPP